MKEALQKKTSAAPRKSTDIKGLNSARSSANSTGTKESEDECAGWFADYESTSKRAAEHYVRTELTEHTAVAASDNTMPL